MKNFISNTVCLVVLLGSFGSVSGQVDNRQKDDPFSGIYIAPNPNNTAKKFDFIEPELQDRKFKESLERAIEKSIQAKELRDFKENDVLTRQQLFEKRSNAETWGGRKKYAIIDKNLGVLENSTETITMVCRDFGNEDGDIVQVKQNGKTIIPHIQLTRSYQKFTIPLVLGVNRIEFVARNEGLYSPNTAGFMIFDQNGKTLMQNDWFLATDAKAYFSIIRLPK
jgi:hypothetical protein